MNRTTALYRVLGCMAYGEWKAHETARREADEAHDEEERRRWQRVAAEELGHHKLFVRRLKALGGDPERAMRPFRATFDRVHAAVPQDDFGLAVHNYVGEGIAYDILQWLRRVVDEETAGAIERVIADEDEHEGNAAEHLRALMGDDPELRAQAGRVARTTIASHLESGRLAPLTAFGSFFAVGRPLTLVQVMVGGFARRMWAIGLTPTGQPVPGILRPASASRQPAEAA